MPLLQIGMSEIPNADAGLGSGVVNVSQQMAALGLAVLSTVAANRTRSLVASGHGLVRQALTIGSQLALYVAAGCVLLGLVLSPILLRTKESPEEAAAHIAEDVAEPRDLRAPGALVQTLGNRYPED